MLKITVFLAGRLLGQTTTLESRIIGGVGIIGGLEKANGLQLSFDHFQ